MTLRYFGRTAQLLEILFILLTSQLPAYLGRGRQLSNLTKSSKFMRETEDTLFWKWLKIQTHCSKMTQNVAFEGFEFWHFPPISSNIKIDISANSVWPQASGFRKLVKLVRFWQFLCTFVHSKYKCSSLLSKCLLRLFLWFSNTVFKFISFLVAFGKMDRLEGTILLMREDLLLGQAG